MANYFPRVREAREALKAKALEIFEKQQEIIAQAMEAGDFETAAKANQFLLEHLPDDDGVRVIAESIDKPKETKGVAGPIVQIGFKLGGVNEPKALPGVIDVDPGPDGDPVDIDPDTL